MHLSVKVNLEHVFTFWSIQLEIPAREAPDNARLLKKPVSSKPSPPDLISNTATSFSVLSSTGL